MNRVDWWGFGCLLYEAHCGYSPFSGDSMSQVHRKIQQVDYTWPSDDKLLAPVSAELRDLCSLLLVPNPLTRLGHGHTGPEHIKEHPYFASIVWELLDTARPPISVPQQGVMDEVLQVLLLPLSCYHIDRWQRHFYVAR